MTYEKIVDLVIGEAEELNERLKDPIPVESGGDAPLYGDDGVLTSVWLVTLIMAVEQSVEDEFGVPVVLADEKAMSQKNSPFRSVGALAGYIQSLLRESGEVNANA